MATLTDQAMPSHLRSSHSPRPIISSLVKDLEATPSSLIQPCAFFVSWQGVLTLAFEGYPPAVLALKDRLIANHPALPNESPGSKWPKTSIGCLNDGVTLTKQQFDILNALCKSLSEKFFSVPSDRPLKIAIDSAAVVLYECRSLEQVLLSHLVPFSSARDSTQPTPEEIQRVKLIVAEADAPDYYQSVAREGNRAAHYTTDCLGATLMHPLQTVTHSTASPRSPRTHVGLMERGLEELEDRLKLFDSIRAFREEVESAFPGLYHWFKDESLHITLREIIL